MKFRKLATSMLLGLVTASSAYAANSLTFQGVTFNSYAVDSDTLELTILNATHATGDWAGVGFIKAFEIKNITTSGDVTDAAMVSGPGLGDHTVTVVDSVEGSVTGSVLGCKVGSSDLTNGACFAFNSPLALSNSMTWRLDFVGPLNFSLPHLKLEFMKNASDTRKTGSLLSMGLPAVPTPVPEPETYAMLLAGLGLLGTFAKRRKV